MPVEDAPIFTYSPWAFVVPVFSTANPQSELLAPLIYEPALYNVRDRDICVAYQPR
jgi:hypothetical protein